ncbi:MAG: NnrU family protein [Tabrizicola sp.]|uniref:NnrU family protein n=1 Tax=Tabrizicola sp. TaxID=2005166 RepID=UPI002ABCB0D5|nr:NnrU family protein [Tabrizicola sp.]MDZ4088891.1 NnrU family protein [Tabrizicola sp.]
MTLIVLGMALWWAAHLWKRLAPASRASMGDPGKGLVTVGVLAGVVLMVIGYRGVEQIDLWYPPAFLTHVNNLLMLFAVYLYAASGMKTRITRVIRHPQLTAVKTWAVAHLLVNGDLASVILFGGLLAWAVVEVILINKAVPRGPLPEPASAGKEVGAVLGAVVVLVAIMLVHNWLGVPPWG